MKAEAADWDSCLCGHVLLSRGLDVNATVVLLLKEWEVTVCLCFTCPESPAGKKQVHLSEGIQTNVCSLLIDC